MKRSTEIFLTTAQVDEMAGLNEAIHEMSLKNKRGVLYAQVFPNEGYMKVGVMDNEEAIEVGAVITKHIARQKAERSREKP